MLRRLAAIHGQLPSSLTLAESLEVSGQVLVAGGFADIRTGEYMGRSVAVKTLRVPLQDDFSKIRKVSIGDNILGNQGTN